MNRLLFHLIAQNKHHLIQNTLEIESGWGSAPDHADAAYDALPNFLVARVSRLWRSGAFATLLRPPQISTKKKREMIQSLFHLISQNKHHLIQNTLKIESSPRPPCREGVRRPPSSSTNFMTLQLFFYNSYTFITLMISPPKSLYKFF